MIDMSKSKKPGKSGHRKSGIMSWTDIPYAQRLAMQQKRNIVANRDHSAKIAMYCLSIAMNKLEGIGYKRLVRFSLHFKKIIDEFYEDQEVGMAHAKRRLDQMGMNISGDFYTDKVVGKSKREQEVYDHSLQAAQIALICGAIAMNDEFGFGEERQIKVSKMANELSGRYAREGEKFLLDEMEKIGFPIVNGTVVAYLDEDGNPVSRGKAKDSEVHYAQAAK